MADETHEYDASIRLEPIEPTPAAKPPRAAASLPASEGWAELEQRGGRQPWVYALVGLGVLLSVSVLGLVAMKIASYKPVDLSELEVAPIRSHSELRKESVRVFSEYEVAAGNAAMTETELTELSEVAALFTTYSEHIEAGETGRLVELIDYDRLMKRTLDHGGLNGWSTLEKNQFHRNLSSYADPVSLWTKLSVVGLVNPQPGGNTRVAYVLGTTSDGDQGEIRFWLYRSDEGWKIYDWERLDLCFSESRLNSAYCRHTGTPAITGFEKWVDLVDESDTLLEEGELEAAKEKLREAERQTPAPGLSDYQWLLTAYRWSALNESDDVLRCCDRIAKPDKIPGAHYQRMLHQQWSNPGAALESLIRYESTVGPTPDTIEQRAQLLSRMGREQEAVVQWRRLLKREPESIAALRKVLFALPQEDKTSFGDDLDRLEDPAKTASTLVAAAGYQDLAALRFLTDYLNRRTPGTPEALRAQAVVDEIAGDYDSAADLLRRAFVTEGDPDAQATSVVNFVRVMAENNQATDALGQISTEKAFEELLYRYDDGEIDITDEEYRKAIEEFGRRFPKNLDLVSRQISQLVDDERYAEAERLARAARERAQALAEGEDEQAETASYQADSLGYLLTRTMFEQGKTLEAYRAADDPAQGFLQLARLALADKRMDHVDWLLEAHRRDHPDDPALEFIRGEVAAQDERWPEAVAAFRRGFEASGETGDLWQWNWRMLTLCVEAGDWESYLATQENKDQALENYADELIERKAWGEFNKMITQQRQGSSYDARLDLLEAEAAWARNRRDDFPSYAFSAVNSDELDLSAYQREDLLERALAAQLSTNQPNKARGWISVVEDSTHRKQLELMLHASSGQPAKALSQIQDLISEGGNATEYYWNDYFGRLFVGGAFRELHEEHPVEAPYRLVQLQAAVLMDRPIELQREKVAAAANRLNPFASTAPLRFAGSTENAFLVRMVDVNLWVACGSGTFRPGWETDSDSLEVEKALDESSAWLAVGTASWQSPDHEKGLEAARHLIAELAPDDTRAWCVPGEYSGGFVAFPAEPESITLWRSTGETAPLKDRAVALVNNTPSDQIAANRRFNQLLRKAAHRFEETPGTRLEVWGVFSGDPPLDPLVINVTSVERTSGSLRFDGTLGRSSTLVEELRSDTPMRIEQYETHAFRVNGGKVFVRP
ncbi:hypothetical protein Mal64_26870 [Pseudobythopirellula maris]|uniref:Tetratricopeptide repeat protein n=1 Tax=Pseudobythopirellula maris TaxID=2527991 RepID=A0A5C5ZIE5_9BACT|nr:hypothetical protein [Pseudobythopirellula maris]TWT87152.1 hypothetical protein Mal64_26870 [Pseudobythopirellula maris]